ncbi:MAG TPA: M28 family metallopeptidase [Planctomycetota bacterium]|jgi:hypothetical protein|nr:M28 family metallopeptidase [Planctomycetota bacterium]
MLPLLLVPFLQEPPSPGTDADLAAALAEISAEEIRATVEGLAAFHTRHTASEALGERGIAGARRWLLERLRAANSSGRLEIAEDPYDAESERIEKTRSANVLAILRGREDPERTYVLSAHYDSRVRDAKDGKARAPGANDDASGTAVVLEVARVFAGREFAATIVFALYSGEEQGLLGSKHHAAALKEARAFVDGMVTNDIVGNTTGANGVKDSRTLRVFSRSAEGADSPSRQLARLAEEMGERAVRDLDVRLVFRLDRFRRSGDHGPFDEAGFPAVRFTEPNEDWRRQHEDPREEEGVAYGDLPEFVDFAYAAKVARANAALLANLARAPRPPGRVEVKGGLSNETRLSWEASAGGEVAGYEVLWRDTTEARWTGRAWVGKPTEATVPVLLDDAIVGVRAVSPGGHRSRAVVPPKMH